MKYAYLILIWRQLHINITVPTYDCHVKEIEWFHHNMCIKREHLLDSILYRQVC